MDLVRVGTAVIGAWRLLRGDKGGLGTLDRGAAGALATSLLASPVTSTSKRSQIVSSVKPKLAW